MLVTVNHSRPHTCAAFRRWSSPAVLHLRGPDAKGFNDTSEACLFSSACSSKRRAECAAPAASSNIGSSLPLSMVLLTSGAMSIKPCWSVSRSAIQEIWQRRTGKHKGKSGEPVTTGWCTNSDQCTESQVGDRCPAGLQRHAIIAVVVGLPLFADPPSANLYQDAAAACPSISR